jgi:hypothetical protein
MSDRKGEQIVYTPGLVPAEYDPAWIESEVHRIAAAMDPASVPVMIAPTLNNFWVNYSAPGSWAQAGFYKDMHGRVHMQGLVKSGDLNSNVFILPVGYRPDADLIMLVAHSGSNSSNSIPILGCRLDIKATGYVNQATGTATGWLSLNCSFALTGR